jgi:hypothetical protein
MDLMHQRNEWFNQCSTLCMGYSEECSTPNVQSQPRLLKKWLAGKNTPLGHGGGTCLPALSKTTPPPSPADPIPNYTRISWKKPGSLTERCIPSGCPGLAFRLSVSPRSPQGPSWRFSSDTLGALAAGPPIPLPAGHTDRMLGKEPGSLTERCMLTGSPGLAFRLRVSPRSPQGPSWRIRPGHPRPLVASRTAGPIRQAGPGFVNPGPPRGLGSRHVFDRQRG